MYSATMYNLHVLVRDDRDSNRPRGYLICATFSNHAIGLIMRDVGIDFIPEEDPLTVLNNCDDRAAEFLGLAGRVMVSLLIPELLRNGIRGQVCEAQRFQRDVNDIWRRLQGWYNLHVFGLLDGHVDTDEHGKHYTTVSRCSHLAPYVHFRRLAT